MDELKESLKELFRRGDIEISVKQTWSEWHGEGQRVSVIIDDETVYDELYLARER